jgi:hypothetical protein
VVPRFSRYQCACSKRLVRTFQLVLPPFNLNPSVIYPSSGNSVQPLSLSYLSGHLALGGLYCLKDSTSSLLNTVVACYHA